MSDADVLNLSNLRQENAALRARLAAVVEALEEIADGAGLEFSDPRVSYETWQLEPGSIEKGRAVLAKAREALR